MKFRRTTSRRFILACLLSAAFAFSASSAALATVMTRLGLDRLIAESHVIAEATVLRSDTRLVFRAGDAKPYTLSRLRLDRIHKGFDAADGTPESIIVRELGGRFGDSELRIDGTPTYAPGERVLVFLRQHPDFPAEYRTYGMAQGKFRILRGAPGVPTSVRQSPLDMAFAQWTDGRMGLVAATTEPAMQLDRVIERIAEVLSRPKSVGASPE